MINYKIFQCPRCKNILYSPNHQKSKLCPNCAKKINIEKQRIIRNAESIDEAIFLVQNLKLPPKLRPLVNSYTEKSYQPKSKPDLFLQFIKEMQKKMNTPLLDETILIEAAIKNGFSEDWILNQFRDLENNGLLIRPRKDKIQFLL